MNKPNPVIHFEMGYTNKARMVKFYESVFSWKTHPMGENMGNYIIAQTTETDEKGMIQTKGTINGGFYQKNEDPLSQAPSIVISVEDIKKSIQDVVTEGGKILGGMNEKGEHTMEPTMIPGVGLWISAMDTENNRFSILQPVL